MPGRPGWKMRRYSAPVSTFPQRRLVKKGLPAEWRSGMVNSVMRSNVDVVLKLTQ